VFWGVVSLIVTFFILWIFLGAGFFAIPAFVAARHEAQIKLGFCCHYSHMTHWILACRFHGMDDEKENGFMVLAWPKNKWPRSVIEEAIAQQNLGTPNDAKNFTKRDHSEN